MSTATATAAETMADLIDLCRRLGDIPPGRVRLRPQPGTATQADLLAAEKSSRRHELVEGTLVEKPMGLDESLWASVLNRILSNWVLPRKLGRVSGEQGGYEL